MFDIQQNMVLHDLWYPKIKGDFEMKLFTVEETAEVLRVKKETIYQWKFSGKINATKVNGKLLFKKEELERLIGA